MTKKIWIELFLTMVAGLVLGLFGPFGTYEMPTVPRVAYWLVFVLAGYAIFRPLIVAGRWLSEEIAIPQILAVGLALVIAAIPMTVLVSHLLMGVAPIKSGQWQDLLPLYLQVWLIGFLINGLFTLLLERPHSLPAVVDGAVIASAHGDIAEPARFEERLSAGFGTPLALNSEDHYVRAIGTAREELVLIRMGDAVREMGAVPGMQVHRSWWVAKAAISRLKRDGRTAKLVLTDGREIPVAREKLAQLRRNGWID